jgi:Flp pilus assembly pilin Flp
MFLGLFTKAQALWFTVKEHFTDETGAVATEYALLLILIAVAIVTAATFLGTAIADRFKAACQALNSTPCS